MSIETALLIWDDISCFGIDDTDNDEDRYRRMALKVYVSLALSQEARFLFANPWSLTKIYPLLMVMVILARTLIAMALLAVSNKQCGEC